MNTIELNKRINHQQEKNTAKHGSSQPTGTLILELEDQVIKLRNAFLHTAEIEVIEERIVNIGALTRAIAESLDR